MSSSFPDPTRARRRRPPGFVVRAVILVADLPAHIADARKKYRTGATRINTIQYIHADPLGTLRRIAEENDGLYSFVSNRQLGLKETR